MCNVESHIVELDSLKIGTYQFDFQLDSSYLSVQENTELLGGDVTVHATLNLREDDYSLAISVQGVVQVTCDRCLDPMDVQIDAQEDVETDPDDKQVDLAWLAYELTIVNLPLVHSHQPGGCNSEMNALLQSHLCTELSEDEDIDGLVE